MTDPAPGVPFGSTYAPAGMVCAPDQLAAGAGVATLRAGGNAVDAAVATSAVLAVTTQHMCGLGGDLFALVASPGGGAPAALNASGRAGSGADPDRLRAEGHQVMPVSRDIRAVPVPGCVDGWVALHERYGRLPLATVLDPARRYALAGFPASPLLAAVAATVAALPGGADFAAATRPGALVRRPGVARALAAIATEGRDGFYLGEFGTGLLQLGPQEYSPGDLAQVQADWAQPLAVDAFGVRLWTVPPNSQGYLTLAGAWIAAGLPLPEEPGDPQWAHLTIEAARFAGHDRVDVLHEHANGQELLAPELLTARRAAISPDSAARLGESYRDGGTIHLCVVDADRMAVSLTQSNAAGFGAGIAEPTTGIFLQNRGLGFNLRAGHPGEYGPRRRPPHTLSPSLVTTSGGALHSVLGTMGGDSQPQILLQLLVRLLHGGEPAGAAMAAPRWALRSRSGQGGFSTWDDRGEVEVDLEAWAPGAWQAGLTQLGHQVARRDSAGHAHGHAQLICDRGDHLEGASDPRAVSGAAAGY
ncbi:MAG: gamma-glutamyltransferase family protein [Mycobacteriales bacterium]